MVLARIWLIRPGDICSTCRLKEECPDQTKCLHLVASAGRSSEGAKTEWKNTDGYFARFPLGVCKVGRIGKTGEQLVINEMENNLAWIAKPDWARQEGIQGFHGQPIIYKGETLGVLAVFEREPVTDEATVWFRMIADHVAVAIANARAFEEIERLKAQLELENTFLKEEVLEAQNFGEIIGQSPAIANLVQQIELVAPTDATALISGESGTGKELVAREIHRRSQRKDHPLVRVNCASIPKDLYESEFFGHAKGAFTGAMKDRAGRFQAADGGTLFLDEVGEIPLEMQSKLLRVLQEGEYERVGEETTRKVNVRIIAATNRKLAQEVEARRFRQDLYYRLNVFPIEVAPLRNRKEDIPLSGHHVHGQRPQKTELHGTGINPGRSGEIAKLSLAGQRAGIAEHHRTRRDFLPVRIGQVRPARAASQRSLTQNTHQEKWRQPRRDSDRRGHAPSAKKRTSKPR